MLKLIRKIGEAKLKQLELLNVLAMWAKVKEQGFDPEEVQSFLLDTRLFSKQENHLHHFGENVLLGRKSPYVRRLPSGETVVLYYNVVKMKDGTTHKLDPMVRAPNTELNNDG